MSDKDLDELLGNLGDDSNEEEPQETVNETTPEPVKVAAPKSKRAVKEEAARSQKAHKYKPGETRNIILMRGSEKGGDRPVPVNYNGKQFTVPRGVEVVVPAPVYEILVNASQDLYDWDPEELSLNKREAASYPVSLK